LGEVISVGRGGFAELHSKMVVTYYTPNKDELIAAIRREFAYLIKEYGFVEVSLGSAQCTNPYAVAYQKAALQVIVEGISYGVSVHAKFRIGKQPGDTPPFEFSLGWLIPLRRPDLMEPQFPDHRGQLVQLPQLAAELKLVADDLLRGDFSILPVVKELMAREHARCETEGKAMELERAEVLSQAAFRAGQFQKVVEILKPYRDLLKSSSKKRLEIALSRMR
jgi:hypothetical protein